MKQLFFAVIAVSCIFCACNSPYVDTPFIPGGGAASRSNVAPGNIIATQGGKRSIELRWDEVSGAVRYNIFKANSPLESFVQCAETTAIQVKFTVPPGSAVYYKVSSVAQDGRESPQSIYVRGTSLAQPVITDITDITEASATVTWYMDNATEDTYKNNLLYTVYCFDGATEVAHIALDGAALAENKAPFGNLKPNVRYEYQVEAYLRGDQSNSEKSEKVDTFTARRMRPAAPVNLRASRGTAADKIELSFELPVMVDVALGNGLFEPKPVYFVISKRLYSESGRNEYQSACSYLGFDNYTPGETVSWADENVSRGVKYEYQVQSYVEEKKTSADSSKASAVGWALSEGSLSFGDIVYELNELGSAYTSAELPLVFDFDPQGETYGYALVETIEPIEDGHENDPDSDFSREIDIPSYDEITNYIARMDLAQKTTEQTPGRGLYSYKVEIKNLNGETIDTVANIGKVEVSENTEPIIVEGFSVQDGYTDRFVFKWHYYANRGYVLYESDGLTPWIEIYTENPDPDDNSTAFNLDHSYNYTAGVTPGLTKYFAIKPYRVVDGEIKWGQTVYASAASRTLGVPALSLSGAVSYSVITATWTPAQKADAYRIKYWYADAGSYAAAETLSTIKATALDIDVGGNYKLSFTPFENNTVDAAKAGKEIQVAVDALNEDLQAKVNIGEIATSSKEIPAHTWLVGPALLDPSATKAASATEINVSWEKITGANGYYVFRRQFNMNNTAEEGAEAIVYYVPASEAASINVTGKNMAVVANEKIDTATVKAAASFAGSRYTLRDMYLSDSEYDGGSYSGHIPAYRDQQNNMAQGFSYRYYIVPVVNRGSSPEPLASIEFVYAKDSANKNTNIASYAIQENGASIRYSGAAAFDKDGFAIGFGQNVSATKGTYSSSGDNENNGIQIVWSAPPRLAAVTGFSPRYNVYRRASGGSAWDTLVSNLAAAQYVDTPQTRGVAYEYVVGITNGGSGAGSQPKDSRRFIEFCGTRRDERNRPDYLGFMLEMVRMVNVSRDERKDDNGNFGELVKWYSGGVANSYSADKNWGIDGYTIFIMNRNINAEWHEIVDISSNLTDQIDQSVLVATGQKSVTVNTTAGDMNMDLLRVMRDYKHYFKVRSYVLNNDGMKVYCPNPPYTYSQNNSSGTTVTVETDYVKWGARQITTNEFITHATLLMAYGLQLANGNSWDTGFFGRTGNASGTGCSGSVSVSSNFGVTSWDIDYNNLREDFQARTGDWVIFGTIQGRLWAGTGATNQYPRSYGSYTNSFITVTGPSDTPGLYTGRIRIGNPGDMSWSDNNGRIHLYYPNDTALQTVTYRGEWTPLPYTGRSNERYQLEEYK